MRWRSKCLSREKSRSKKEVNIVKLIVNKDGVFLDDQQIRWVTRIDLQNIDPDDGMEAVLHVLVTEAEIDWKVRE